MSKKNSNLHTAKREKNDEFYTQYYDIEKEIQAYLDYNHDVFKGKTVLSSVAVKPRPFNAWI